MGKKTKKIAQRDSKNNWNLEEIKAQAIKDYRKYQKISSVAPEPENLASGSFCFISKKSSDTI